MLELLGCYYTVVGSLAMIILMGKRADDKKIISDLTKLPVLFIFFSLALFPFPLATSSDDLINFGCFTSIILSVATPHWTCACGRDRPQTLTLAPHCNALPFGPEVQPNINLIIGHFPAGCGSR